MTMTTGESTANADLPYDANADLIAKARHTPKGGIADRLADALEAALPDDLRRNGWSVAAHNDYRQGGKSFTFWLVTKDGRAVKGEGLTDIDALNEIRAALVPVPAAREAAAKAAVTVRPPIAAHDAPPAELGPNQKKFRGLAKQRFRQWGEVIAWSRNTLKELIEKSVKDWTESEWERLTVLFEIEREEAQAAAAPATDDGTQGQLTGQGEYQRV